MGMPDAFGPAADFSGLNNLQGSLYLSGVFHKAWADFNEEGAEAAAATIAVLGFGSEASGNSPSVFRADHPFIFLIRDTPSGSLLFIGRLADPRASV
jgi:serpin B